MPELSRLLFAVAAIGVVAGCTATMPDPTPSGSAATGPSPNARPDAGGETARGPAAPGEGVVDLSELDPATRRRLELWQQAMAQIEPCLRPRLSAVDDIDAAGVVAVQVEYDQAGAPLGADLQPGAQRRIQENATYRAVVNAILNGVRECAPLADMPDEEFDTWRLLPVVIRPRAA